MLTLSLPHGCSRRPNQSTKTARIVRAAPQLTVNDIYRFIHAADNTVVPRIWGISSISGSGIFGMFLLFN